MQHTAVATALTRSFAEMPAFKMAIRSALPSGSLDTRWMHKVDVDFSPLWRQASGGDLPHVATNVFSSSLADLYPGFGRLSAAMQRLLLPPNLRSIDGLRPDDLEDVLNDAIPLFLVPRARIAKRLLNAPDTAARRAVIGTCYGAILEDCESLISRCERSDLAFARDAVQEAIDVARAGQTRAAQALAGAVMDSFTWQWLRQGGVTKKDWDMLTRKGRKPPTDDFFDEWALAAAYAWRPVWAAFSEYRPQTNARLPTSFNRHGTLHRVSHQQYSKRNTAIAIMFATSLLGYMFQWDR